MAGTVALVAWWAGVARRFVEPRRAASGDGASVVVLLPGRSRFIAMERPALRFAQVLSVPRPTDRKRWFRLAIFASAADLSLASLLRRTESEFIGPRLIADIADVALWASCDPNSAAAAILLNAPLTTEIAVRRTPRQAAVVAGAVFTIAMVRRRRNGLILNPFDALWALIGPATGLVWRRNERSETRRLQALYHDDIAARVDSATLAGQREVAMATDSVVDLLCRTIPLIDPDNGGVMLRGPIADWKASVAHATRISGATFLGDLIARWQAFRNTDPNVASWVWPTLIEDDGTVLLHPEQALQMWEELARDTIRGHVAVTVDNPLEARLHEHPRVITIGGKSFTLSSPPKQRPAWRIEPTPVALVLGALWVLVTADKRRYAVPKPVVAATTAAYVGGAVFVQTVLLRDRTAGRKAAITTASSLSAVFAATASYTSRHATVTGSQHPATAGANTLGLVAAIWWPELDRRDRLKVLGGAAATLVGAWLGNPKRRSPSIFASELVWPLIAFEASKIVPNVLCAHADRLMTDLEERADLNVRDAADTGRTSAMAVVSGMVTAARTLLETNRVRIDERLAKEATTRIELCEREVASWMTSESTR